MISNFKFSEINPDSSKLSEDLREIQNMVQYYSNQLYEIPRNIEEILKKQEEIFLTLKDLQMKIQNLEQTSSSRKGGRLPIFFGTEPLLHQKGKTKVVQKPLTDEEMMINLIKELSEKNTM